MRRLLGRRTMMAVLLTTVALLNLPLTGVAANTGKEFTATVAPGSVAAGSTTVFTVVITNRNPQQQLGSANVTVPAVFTSLRLAGTTRGTARLVGSTIELRDLALGFEQAVITTVQVTAPCAAAQTTFVTEAKQANNFSGPPGNTYTLRTAGSSLEVSVTGQCRLEFLDHPADTEVGKRIRSTALAASKPGFDPVDPTAMVKVRFVDGDGETVTSASGAVTVTAPSEVRLTGGGPVAAVAGVATFPDLAITAPAHGVRLTATSGTAATTSRPFAVWETVQACTAGGGCEASASRDKTISVSMRGSGDKGFVTASVDVMPPAAVTCDDGLKHAPIVATVHSYDVEGEKTATLTIDKQVVRRQGTPNGAPHYGVCFLADPTEDEPTPQVQALDFCGTAPCILQKNKTGAGDIVITIRLPEGDPHFR